MYTLIKYDLKILRYINRHRNGVSRAKLLRKFKRNPKQIDILCNLEYISHNYTFPCDKDGFPIGSIPDTAIYQIEGLGIAEVESHQWFDVQYVITQILVPIVIALLTYALTFFLSKYFG